MTLEVYYVDVVVVGAGPTGMMLAADLAVAGVDVMVVERRPSSDLVGSRAGGFHARTLEIFDQRGVVDRFLADGTTHPVPHVGAASGMAFLDISDFPTRHPYTLGLFQNDIERILATWIEDLKVPIKRGRTVIGMSQVDSGVDVSLNDGSVLRTSYLVGADGGRSLIRKLAGIEFPGWEASMSAMIAEVELSEPTPSGITYDERGLHGLSLMADGRTTRVITTEREVYHSDEPTLEDLQAQLRGVFGTDFGAHNPTWISRFTDATRQAAEYRQGRVLLAGDAAHIHSPAGGQGIGLGIQDAVNLSWKLAQVVHGESPDSLLDTYRAERHPATARALEYTMATSALHRPGPRVSALREQVQWFGTFPEVRINLAGLITGLDVHYDLGTGHPLLGRRMPDLDLLVGGRQVRVYSFLRDVRPVLINFADARSPDLDLWAERVQLVDAAYGGDWLLPVLGHVSAPTGVLVRPDGYVAWVGEGTTSGQLDALDRWCGPQPT
ncbi:MAG: FAD-dependent monooxygenase [Mycobacteriales bacterium]